MNKPFGLFIWASCMFRTSPARVQITERTSALPIEPGYNVSESDSLFSYRQHKYLVKTHEFFDAKGEITKVILWGSEGYWVLSKQRLDMKTKSEKNVIGKISVTILDDHHIVLNSDTIKVDEINKQQHQIFYTSKNEVVNTSRLTYK